MIEVKRWGEFLFAFWKVVKANQTVEDWTKFMDTGDKLMNDFPESVFRVMILGLLEQKSMESIRSEGKT